MTLFIKKNLQHKAQKQLTRTSTQVNQKLIRATN